MALAGPATSFVIGLGSIAMALILAPELVGFWKTDPDVAIASAGPLTTLLYWLGPVNVWLAVFNLVPGFPLDGGRVFRAAAWWATGDLRRATRWASTMGRIVGAGLIALGAIYLFGGALVTGLWTMLIGWFLYGAARQGYMQLVARDVLGTVHVDRVMRTGPALVAYTDSIESVVNEHFVANGEHAVPVTDGGRLVGMVSLYDVRRVPRDDWPSTPVSAVMTDARELPTVAPETSAAEALEKLSATGYDELPVLEGGTVRGVVRLRDLLRWVSIADPAFGG
jgi:CBS domain-containing protein